MHIAHISYLPLAHYMRLLSKIATSTDEIILKVECGALHVPGRLTCSYFHSKLQHPGCDCKWSPTYWNIEWSIHSLKSSRGTERELSQCLLRCYISSPCSPCQHSPSAGRLQYHHWSTIHGCKWYPNFQSAKFLPDPWHIQRMRCTCSPDEELPQAGWLCVQQEHKRDTFTLANSSYDVQWIRMHIYMYIWWEQTMSITSSTRFDISTHMASSDTCSNTQWPGSRWY